MITFDFETKSYADLKKVGTWVYSEDPTTDVICCAYAIDDGPIHTWWPGKYTEDTTPLQLYTALYEGDIIEAHNVAFERSIWMNVMAKKYDWDVPADTQWRDTMAVACYYALPASLDQLARALGGEGKDPEGARLITKYSKLYLKTAKKEIPDEDFEKFVSYCQQDVAIERGISNYLGDLPQRELPTFHLDQRINLRGIALDRAGIDIATAVVAKRAADLATEFRQITGLNPTQGEKLHDWFQAQGVELDNLQAAYLRDRLDDIGQGPARRAIELRLQINKASTKKLDAMSRQCGVDGRARFQTRYHGAVTGRWTGRGFQPLNLSRGYEDMDPAQLVRDIAYGDPAWLDTLYGEAMDAAAKASRHWIKARQGCRIIAGDFSSVEAVILSCLAGEVWKVKAFREGVKLYEYMADKIHRLAPGTVNKADYPAERQDGKTGELAFGYQGALGAWLKFDASGRHTDAKIIEICSAWRDEHPATTAFWRNLQDGAIQAVRTGELQLVGQIGFEIVDHWLTMILPNGKRIWYFEPRVVSGRPHWCQPSQHTKCATGACSHELVPQLSYMAQKTGQWVRISTYGGKLAENACQATSRELLVPAMFRAEEAGYPIILTVYDEIVCEVPDGHGSLEEFVSIMEGPLPDWAHDWPITASAWEGDRYKK
jgi:DNA polymerase